MKRGFTLLEVVVALLVLELGVLGVVGTMVIASRTLGRAERLERAVAEAEGVLDSLSGATTLEPGQRSFVGGEVEWWVDGDGAVVITALGPTEDTLFVVLTLPSGG